MWNPRTLENAPDLVAETLTRRGTDMGLEDLAELITNRKALLREEEGLNAERRNLAKGKPTPAQIAEARAVRTQTNAVREQRTAVEEALRAIAAQIPNQPHLTVPDGVGEDDNVLVHAWGEPTRFEFEPKDHVDLAEGGGLDLERGARLSGSGFPVLRGDLARLNRALITFMLELHRARGYTEIAVPFAVRKEALYGTGQMPKFDEDLFWVGDHELGLIPTAEVPLTNLHAGEILDPEQLPMQFTAYSPCFRREAGGYGRDTRGIVRVHQFEKVELVHIVDPEGSYHALERLVDDAEEVLRQLGLPHRRMALCAGDMGFAAAKTYDLEVWLPGQQRYREISSCSNCEAFQSRRMNLRMRDGRGKPVFAHTLNGSGLAVGRTLVAVLENYQRADRCVDVPEVLQPLLGGQTVIDPRVG